MWLVAKEEEEWCCTVHVYEYLLVIIIEAADIATKPAERVTTSVLAVEKGTHKVEQDHDRGDQKRRRHVACR